MPPLHHTTLTSFVGEDRSSIQHKSQAEAHAEIASPESPTVVGTTTVIEAGDGFPLAVEHFRSKAQAPGMSLPIVLCHGFGGNRFNFDLDETHSLARHLADEGFDVWIVELRGHGRSRPGPSPRRRRMAKGWNMDDHIEKDVPAMLEAITRLSTRPRVIWVGHSLGGMVAYCLLSRYPEYARFFAGLVTIGSPAHVERPKGLPLAPAILLMKMLKRRGAIPVRLIARIMCSSTGRRFGFTRLWRHWANPENVVQAVVAGTVRHGLENFSPGILHQWLFSMGHKGLVSCDGFDYFLNLGRVEVPILFITGTADQIAPIPTILTAFERIRSGDKSVRAFGRNGFELKQNSLPEPRHDSVDYGHEDLLLGEASRSEVFPYITDWLRAHAASGEG